MTDLATIRKLVQAKRDLLMLSYSLDELDAKAGTSEHENDSLRLMQQAEGLHIAIHIVAGRVERVIDDAHVES